jgi:opacity protein-like surface antigen
MKLVNNLCVLLALLFVTTTAQAQLSVGGGLGYGLDIEELAIQARGVYGINDQFRGEADFNYYLEGTDGLSYWEFNLNANYMITNTGGFDIYALAGLNFFHFNIDLGPFGNSSDTDTGLNIGGGAEMGLTDSVKLFGEAKFALGGAEQLFLAVGALFNL